MKLQTVGRYTHDGCGVTTASGFCINRGVNISHWLSQTICNQRNLYFNEDDLQTIKDLGFDHVRIPIDEHEMWNDDGLIIGRSFLMLKKCLDMCIRHSLRAVVVIKRLRCSVDVEYGGTSSLWTSLLAQENIMKLWRNLSDFLKDYPRTMLAYELLNEPDAPDASQWNILFASILDVIRKREPERAVIVGSNMRQSESSVKMLALPNDSNIVVSIRFFKPFGFTHFRAEWTPMNAYSGPVQYPGQTINPDYLFLNERTSPQLIKLIEDEQVLQHWDKQQLIEALQPAAEFCARSGAGLYCSQFGCLPTVPAEMRSQYYADILSCFRQLGLAYSFWDFKGRFGVLSRSAGSGFIPDTAVLGTI